MKLLSILKERAYLLFFILATLLLFFLYVYLQVSATGGLQNVGLWFAEIPPLNLLIFTIISILFGLLLTLQVYHWKNPECKLHRRVGGASSTGAGAILAIIVPACPACLSFATLILPAATALSFGQFIVKYNTLLQLLSMSLMILGIYLLGGFQKE